MHKKLIGLGVGIALLASPLLALAPDYNDLF